MTCTWEKTLYTHTCMFKLHTWILFIRFPLRIKQTRFSFSLYNIKPAYLFSGIKRKKSRHKSPETGSELANYKSAASFLSDMFTQRRDNTNTRYTFMVLYFITKSDPSVNIFPLVLCLLIPDSWFWWQHTNMVMMGMATLAIILAVLPFKFIIMSFMLYIFTMTSRLRKNTENEQGNRRLKEWWDSIPIIPVEIVEKQQDGSSKTLCHDD